MKLSVLSLGFALLAASSAVAQNGSWAPKQAATTIYRSGSYATDGTYLFAIGGYPDPYTLNKRFDPVSNTWSLMTSIPTATSSSCAAYYNGSIYSFSRWNGAGEIDSYNLAANSWARVNGATTVNLTGAAACTLGTRIYVTGGFVNGGGATSIVSAFDPAANTVTQVAPMPAAFGYHSMASVASTGKLYVLGGNTAIISTGAGLSSCYEYDQATNVWSTRAAMNIAGTAATRDQHAAFAINGKVYVTGGRTINTYYNTTLEFSPTTNQWASRAPMSTTRISHAGVAIAARGYVYGGYNTSAGPELSSCEMFTPPSTGLAPAAATNVTQTGLAGLMAQGGWTGNKVTFSGTITDPDVENGQPQQVQFEVQVKPAAAAWTSAVTLTSPLSAQNQAIAIDYTLPAAGDYDWRFHSADSAGNVTPNTAGVPGWTEFNNNVVTPDFSSDQVAPTVPTGLSPVNADARVFDQRGGPVTFGWSVSTDNSGQPVLYEMEVHSDLTSGTLLGGAVGVSSTSVALHLVPSPSARYWRVRAKDFAGTVSAWSPLYMFRVVYEDANDNGAGDAKAACGMSAPGTSGIGLIVLVMAALSMRRRLF